MTKFATGGLIQRSHDRTNLDFIHQDSGHEFHLAGNLDAPDWMPAGSIHAGYQHQPDQQTTSKTLAIRGL